MPNDYFIKLVELYRVIPKANIEEFLENKFYFSGIYGVDIANKIQELKDNYPKEFFQNFEDDFSQFNVGDKISFEFKFPQNESGRFFKNLESLINNKPSINKGEYFGNYYIIDMDFLGDELSFSRENIPQELKKLKNICLLISFLRKIGEYNNSSTINIILKSSVYGDCIAIDSKISIDAFNNINNNFIFSEKLCDLMDLNDKNFHRLEKIMLLKSAIAKYSYDKYRTINDVKIDFIANNWGSIYELYKNNLSAYLDNFSFDKTDREITEEKLKFVQSIDSIIRESSTKILSVPISLVAVITAINAKENFAITNIFTVISLLIFGIIINRSLILQEKIKNTIYEQANDIFNDDSNNQNSEISSKISTALAQISDTSKEFDKIISLFNGLSILPLCLLVLFLCCKLILLIMSACIEMPLWLIFLISE